MKSLKFLLFFLIFTFIGFISRADFISLIKADQCETIIEMHIEEDQIRITFEIGMNDLEYFKELIPKEYLTDEIKALLEESDADAFYKDVFVVTADGKKLIGKISKREFMPRKYRASLYTGQVDTNFNISTVVLFTEIVYPVKRKPMVVSITPPIMEGCQTTMANIGFITYHKNIPVNDLRYLGQEATINLSWDDPWYSRFENRNLRRHHQSSLMSFLYVDPYEVRHEVLVRVKDFEYWLDFDYSIDDYIEISGQINTMPY